MFSFIEAVRFIADKLGGRESEDIIIDLILYIYRTHDGSHIIEIINTWQIISVKVINYTIVVLHIAYNGLTKYINAFMGAFYVTHIFQNMCVHTTRVKFYRQKYLLVSKLVVSQ